MPYEKTPIERSLDIKSAQIHCKWLLNCTNVKALYNQLVVKLKKQGWLPRPADVQVAINKINVTAWACGHKVHLVAIA